MGQAAEQIREFSRAVYFTWGCAPSRPIYSWDDPEVVPSEKLQELRKTRFPSSAHSLSYTPYYATLLLL